MEAHEEDVEILRDSIEVIQDSEESLILNDWINTSDSFLYRFLVMTNFDQAKALAWYTKYYATVINIPKITPIIHDKLAINDVVDQLLAIAQTKAGRFYGFDQQKRAILSFFPTRLKPEHLYRKSLIMPLNMLIGVEYLLSLGEDVVKNGVIFVDDYSGFTNANFMHFYGSIKMLKIFGKLFGGALPLKIHTVVEINCPLTMTIPMSIMAPFVSKETLDRLVLIKNDVYEPLYRILGGVEYTPDFVPGGCLKPKDITLTEADILRLLKSSLPLKYLL